MRNIKYILFLWLVASCSKDEIPVPIPPVEPPVVCEIDYFSLQSGINKLTSHYQPYNIPFVDYTTFFSPSAAVTGYSGIYFASGNFNGNDYPDHVAAEADASKPTSNRISIMVDEVIKFTFINPQKLTRKIAVADINQDSIDDIILIGLGEDVASAVGDEIFVIYMYHDSYEIVKVDAPSGYYHTGQAGELDGNGIDLLYFDAQAFEKFPTGFVKFYSNNGNKEWIEKETNITTHYIARTYNSELVDINNDGILDLLLGGHEWEEEWMSSSPRHVEWRTHILTGKGNGLFDIDNPIMLPIIENWGIITDFDVYDIDNDGLNEIIVTRTTGRDGLPGLPWPDQGYDGHLFQVIKTDGSNWFESQRIEMPVNLFQYAQHEEWPFVTKIYDVNKDCLLDIVPESDKLNAKSFSSLNNVRGLYYEQQEDNTFKIKYKK